MAIQSKKVAPAPLKKTVAAPAPKTDARMEKRQRNFSIGNNIQPKRDMSRYIKWPVYVRFQRQKAILKKRLKVPPTVNQFNHVLDKNTATQVFRLLNKYTPETKVEKKQRLAAIAAQVQAGQTPEKTPKPIVAKYGLNHVTALIENKKASLVLIAHDVEPLELVIFLPALCRKMGIPYAIVKGKARLGTVVNQKKATVVALTEVKPEHKHEFSSIVSAIKANFNDKFEEIRKQWGGNVLGHKSTIKLAKREAAAKKAIEIRAI